MGRTIQVSGFPSSVSVEAVKEFLENHAGKDTVYALRVRPCKVKGLQQRAFAIVQFTSAASAELISSLINQNLRYGISYLKVYNVENDIVAKPRASMLSLEITALHFGCQVSSEKFCGLWKGVGAVVNFGFGLRKVEFLLMHCGVEYKLEISYKSIWAIQLRRPRNLRRKFLLIQVLAAPKIYEKPQSSSGHTYGYTSSDYFKDEGNDQWVRATDFTNSYCIGQSSAICLELPYSCEFPPQIRENFPYYKEDEGQFCVESGSSFSHNLDLVPIVGPPRGIELPYEVLFKINLLVQNGCLAGPTLDASFFASVNPEFIPSAYIEHALERLYHLNECCYEPVKWLDEQYAKYRQAVHFPNAPGISLGDGLVYIRRVQITPSKVYFCRPEVIVSNRVLRNYHNAVDNFIRVSFVDEEGEKLRSTDLSPRTSKNEDRKHTAIYRRILSTLRNGIVIGDKKFDLLAFSSSQLRESSAWMFASKDGLTAACIREWMGDFREIRNVAKYAARLGQSFSSSKETLTVLMEEREIIPDIEIDRSGVKYIFSDGIGKISTSFAQKVAKKCGIDHFVPSAFQIRYGGYKGVVAVDPTSVTKLSLRKSMFKYTSDNTGLDVLNWSKSQPCFLNRQLITLLSTLGVRDHIFEKKQKEVVDQLDMILKDPVRAQEALDVMSPGENVNVLKEMLLCGYKPDAEPFLSMMLQTFRASKLQELRNRSRIYIPNGRSMMGCLDETRTLEYGQVFVQFSGFGTKQVSDNMLVTYRGKRSNQRNSIVEGKVIVAKNPCLHPGDLRVLQAVNVPDLHHMVDCVVFPQKGIRPHPNECSGSDLDGDIYFVSWDTELIPPRQIQPMDYTPATSAVRLDHDVTIEDIQEYFTNYMLNDSLGVIANAHTAFADKESGMAESGACMELARLFSVAVDFPKTGVPAAIPPHLHVKEYPDFMEKLDKPSYPSQRVIGKLFREVKEITPQTNCIPSFTWAVAKKSYDFDMEFDGFEDYLDDAYYLKGKYDFKLGNLMNYYGIKTEAEIIGKSIISTSKSFDRKKDAEAVGLAVKSLKKEARNWFDDKGSKSGETAGEKYAKASAWYHVTYHPNYWGIYNEGMKRDHFLSFPWCVYDKLIHIKKNNSKRRQLDEPLNYQFKHGLRLI